MTAGTRPAWRASWRSTSGLCSRGGATTTRPDDCLGWLSRLHVPRFGPSFVILATKASVAAIFLSTFVLISQNRVNALPIRSNANAYKRADPDLQVSLLAEHEVTRLISLVTAMAQKMGIEGAGDPELAELAQDVAPERVLDEVETSAANAAAIYFCAFASLWPQILGLVGSRSGFNRPQGHNPPFSVRPPLAQTPPPTAHTNAAAPNARA